MRNIISLPTYTLWYLEATTGCLSWNIEKLSRLEKDEK